MRLETLTKSRWVAGGLIAAFLTLGPTTSVLAASDRLDIEYVKTDEFLAKGTIQFYVDLLDDDYKVISGLSGDEITVFIDGQEVPGTVQVQSFSEAQERVAVAILMNGSRGYAKLEAAEDDEGNAVQGPPEVFGLQKQGFAEFVKKLDTNDHFSVYLYNEAGLRVVDNWSQDPTGAADRIEKNAKLSDESKSSPLPPLLYKSVKDIVDGKIAEAENLPRRKILLVMSDGKDRFESQAKKLEGTIDQIVEAAKANGVRIYTLGFTMDLPDPLVQFSSLASKTSGIHRELDAGRVTEIPMVLENIATELKKQYVVTFKPHEDFKGAEEAVKVRLKLKSPRGSTLEKEYTEPVKIQKKPFDWMGLLKWIGIGLGSLLGLFLVWKLVAGILRARRNAASQPVVEEQYSGPYKGKLLATGGGLIGTEYFLTEDVTTIGSIQGNAIVLSGPGVSKRHAGIKIEDMRFELADFGSTNGTYVNGTKITKQFLRDGDLVSIGDNELRFTLK